MKKVLCATDFSDNSDKALKYACILSKQLGMELIILHVYDIPTILSGPSDAATASDMSREVIKKDLEKLRTFCQNQSGSNGENVRLEVRENKNTDDGIVAMIKEIHADIVVMGTKGASNIREVIMGSTSFGVIKKASCPVITVPENVNYDSFMQRVAYATDINDNDFEILNGLKDMVKPLDAEIFIIHVSTDREQVSKESIELFQNELKNKVAYDKLHFDVVHANNKSDSLYQYAKDNDINLIAMFEHENKNIFNKWFKKDLVKQVEFTMDIPMISFNENYLTSTIN